jgi:hypothetical protein
VNNGNKEIGLTMSSPEDSAAQISKSLAASGNSIGKPSTRSMSGLEYFSSGAFRWKRATDLLPPPQDGKPLDAFLDTSKDRSKLLHSLALNQRTCCVKTTNDKTGCRGALVLWHGRAVGAVYTSKLMPELQSTEASLRLLLSEFGSPAATVYVYDLPENVVLPLATMFIGTSLDRADQMSSREYFDLMLATSKQEKKTVCMPFAVGFQTAMVYIHRGDFIGCFYVDEQKISKDLARAQQLLDAEKTSHVYACIFNENQQEGPSLGFGLS